MHRDPRLTGFDSLIHRAMKAWNVPGTAIGIVRGEQIIHAKGYGLRDLRRGLPVTEKTCFGIGSCTKAFTATALAILADAGKIDWDTPVRHYLPSFQLCDPAATERSTLRDLLTHRTGLPGHNFAWVASRATRTQMLERLRHLQPTADFRARYQYNNLMYMVAGALLERITGRSWEQFLAERIFEPLGMTDTFCFHADMTKADNLAIGYDRVRRRLCPWRRAPGLDIFRYEGPCGPAGAICSNVIDMCKWLRLQMGGGDLGKHIVLSRSALQQMHTPQVAGGEAIPAGVADAELLDACYGMGWAIQPYRGHRMLYHTGLVGGYNAVVSFLPAEALGIVVLANFRGSPVWPVAMCTAYDCLLGLAPIHWLSRWKRYMQRRETDRRRQKRQQHRSRDTHPPRPLADYVGTYCHAGYGTVQIRLERGRLRLRCNDVLAYNLKHCPGHAWQMVASNEVWDVTFGQDEIGCIDSITIPFEPTAPCTFSRSGGRHH